MSYHLFSLVFAVCVYYVANVEGQNYPCKRFGYETSRVNHKTIVVETHNRLLGTWMSENCETRPGPEFVLRVYTFHADGNYKLLQHHYWDDSCVEPKLSISVTGTLRIDTDLFSYPEKSAFTIYDHRKITLTAHTNEAIRELNSTIAMECPGRTYQRQWLVGEQKVVFEQQPLFERDNRPVYDDVNRRKIAKLSVMPCLGSLKWAFNELNLIRVQLKPEYLSDDQNPLYRHELLLGDIHSRFENRDGYSPSAFQDPLFKYSAESKPTFQLGRKIYFLSRCRNISTILISGTEKNPPKLVKKPTLPPNIWGDWISTKCEIRPLGIFLTRYFRFDNRESSWFSEHRFYSDPFCLHVKFVLNVNGYINVHLNNPNFKLPFATNSRTVPVDFHIKEANLIVHDHDALRGFKRSPPQSCGTEVWQLGRVRDLTETGGCWQLGVTVPSIQFEILKMEFDFVTDYGSIPTLYLGQADTDNLPRPMGQRPTAFQSPLIQCTTSEVDINNSAISVRSFGYFSVFLFVYLLF